VSEAGETAPLPEWPPRAAGFLIVSGPHAIPISTAIRAGDRRLLFGLAQGRETLARVRAHPRAAFALLAEGAAFTAYGSVNVARDRLEAAPNVAALELLVEHLQDHLADGRTEILAAASWRWLEEDAREADREVLSEIEALARAGYRR
jgi:hypothetical protein